MGCSPVNYTIDIKYSSGKKMLMLMDSLESERSLAGMGHKVIFHGLIKAVCQSVLVETEQCPLNESVDLTTHHIDSGGCTGKFTSGHFTD